MSGGKIVLLLLGLAALGSLPFTVKGCGPDVNNGPGTAMALMRGQQEAEEYLKGRGVKLTQKSYPQGVATAVDATGAKVDDELFAAIKSLGYVAELNLSKSDITDEQMVKINDFATVLFKVDLSETSIGDVGLYMLEGGFLRQIDVSGTKVTDRGMDAFLKKRSDDKQISSGFKKVNFKK